MAPATERPGPDVLGRFQLPLICGKGRTGAVFQCWSTTSWRPYDPLEKSPRGAYPEREDPLHAARVAYCERRTLNQVSQYEHLRSPLGEMSVDPVHLAPQWSHLVLMYDRFALGSWSILLSASPSILWTTEF